MIPIPMNLPNFTQGTSGPAYSSVGNSLVAQPGLGNLSELINIVTSGPSQNGGGFYGGSQVPLSAYSTAIAAQGPVAPVQVQAAIPTTSILVVVGVAVALGLLLTR